MHSVPDEISTLIGRCDAYVCSLKLNQEKRSSTGDEREQRRGDCPLLTWLASYITQSPKEEAVQRELINYPMTRGSGMTTWIALLITAGLCQSTTATTFTVGGTVGWTLGVGPTFYDEWAKPLAFVPGDKLVFSYPGATHNVFEVSKVDLDSCNFVAPLKTYETVGGASVTLTTPGEHYFICGIPGHCLANMKMTVRVSPAALTPAKAPAAHKPTHKPASKKHLAPGPAPTPEIAPVPTPSSDKPIGQTKNGASTSTDRSALAMILGAVLCVAASLLFR